MCSASATGSPCESSVTVLHGADDTTSMPSLRASVVVTELSSPRNSSSAESAGQPGDFRVKLALTVCSAEPVADCGACVFCLDKPKFGGAGTKRQSCVVRRAAPTGVPRVHTPLRVVSTQYLQQLERYTQVTVEEDEQDGDEAQDVLSPLAKSCLCSAPASRSSTNNLSTDSIDSEEDGERLYQESDSDSDSDSYSDSHSQIPADSHSLTPTV